MSKKYDNNLNEIKDTVPIKTFSITSGGVNIENLGQPVNIDTYEEENKQLKQQLAEKDKEIDKLEQELAFYNEEVKNRGTCGLCEKLEEKAINVLRDKLKEKDKQFKDQRHQICEEIREWCEENEFEVENADQSSDSVIYTYKQLFKKLDKIEKGE